MKSILFIVALQLGLGACAQSFLWDGTIQPFFNISNQPNASINDIHELQSGSVILLGNFTQSGQSGIQFSGITSVLSNGSVNPSFVGLGGFPSFLSNKRDTNLVVSGTGINNIKIDTNGLVFHYFSTMVRLLCRIQRTILVCLVLLSMAQIPFLASTLLR